MKIINGLVLSGDEKSQKMVVQACISFQELIKHSVFSYMRDPNENPYKQDAFDEAEEKNKYYQRRIDQTRISKIKAFIRSSIMDELEGRRAVAVFPTAMILSYVDENTNYGVGDIVPLQLSDNVYVVDGQHRLYAMQKLYDEVKFATSSECDDENIKKYIEKYKFNCTILLNFDLWEQSQVFVEVNFNQRKVSKSLYYDIYGMYYNDTYANDPRNYIYVAHMLVKYMNSVDDSPFKGKIKMLGNSYGLVSQSCFAESLMRNMSSRVGIWRINIEDSTRKPSYKYMAIELKAFYQVVEKMFADIWPTNNQHKSIICKTAGISSMIRLLGYIHQNCLNANLQERLSISDDTVILEYKDVLEKEIFKLYFERHRLFGLNGAYSKTGGKGIESSLYRDMCEILSAKIEDVSHETLDALRLWLSLYPDSGHPLDEERYGQFISRAKANHDKITGYILYKLLEKEQTKWSDKKIDFFITEVIEKIRVALGYN